MATIHFAITAVDMKGTGIPSSRIILDEVMSTTTTARRTNIEVPGDRVTHASHEAFYENRLVWVVTVNGGNVWVRFSSPTGLAASTPESSPTILDPSTAPYLEFSPEADASNAWFVLDGTTRAFVAYPGDCASAIDAGA